MTDYAKHIEDGQALLDLCGGRAASMMVEREFVTAAIELMRAARPKSAEAEREYCEQIANVVQTWEDKVLAYMESRASARTEGYAQRKAEENSK